MSKKANQYEATFLKITGQDSSEDLKKTPDTTKSSPEHSEQSASSPTPLDNKQSKYIEKEVQGNIETLGKKRRGRPQSDNKDSPYVHKAYYITPEHVKALRRRAYLDDSLDLSGHVRAALDLYLADDLEAIRKGAL